MHENIGPFIRDERLKSKISLNSMARILGIWPSYLWKMENGLLELKDDHIEEISLVLGYNVFEKWLYCTEPIEVGKPITVKEELGKKIIRNNTSFEPEDILKIRKEREDGIKVKDIAKKWGVSAKAIYDIIARRSFSDI